MKRKKVWRYYCEFCKKGGCSAGHMARHESRCTRNPNRSCGMCEVAGFAPSHPIPELVAALGKGDKRGVENLRNVAEGCPACMLAAIIHSKIQAPADEEGPGVHVDFDFKKEKEYFWNEVNANAMSRECL